MIAVFEESLIIGGIIDQTISTLRDLADTDLFFPSLSLDLKLQYSYIQTFLFLFETHSQHNLVV